MKICLLSDYAGMDDEGMRKIAFYFEKELAQRHQVLQLCLRPVRNVLRPHFWQQVRNFHPDIIHYVPGPSAKSIFFMKVLKTCCNLAKTVISATHPFISPWFKPLLPLFKPDLILTQSQETEKMFRNLGCATHFLPSGVDTERFLPPSGETRRELRQKYNLDGNKIIVTHVGAVQKERNVLMLTRMQREENVQVLIIGSVSLNMEPLVYQNLERNGCLVWRRYFPKIEEIYALSDCYIFPTVNKYKCVELPLSVLEAMSCNLPVITTPFKALPEMFSPGEGLYFVRKEEEFIEYLQDIRAANTSVKTRQKVLPYSWSKVVGELEQIYAGLISK